MSPLFPGLGVALGPGGAESGLCVAWIASVTSKLAQKDEKSFQGEARQGKRKI